MAKKFGIFVSSTYTDLIEERRAISEKILNYGHIPMGMELFSNTGETSDEIIKKAIDDSDYLLLITAGRYGSLIEGGEISFVEMEYDYAIEKKKKILWFPVKDINKLTNEKVDKDNELSKLKNFNKKIENTGLYRGEWQGIDELKDKVGISLASLARSEMPGWVRAEENDNIKASAEEQVNEYITSNNINFFSNSHYDNSKLKKKLADYDYIYILHTTGTGMIKNFYDWFPNMLKRGKDIVVLLPERFSDFCNDVGYCEFPDTPERRIKELGDEFKSTINHLQRSVDEAYNDESKAIENRELIDEYTDENKYFYRKRFENEIKHNKHTKIGNVYGNVYIGCSYTLLRETITFGYSEKNNECFGQISLTMPPAKAADGTPTLIFSGNFQEEGSIAKTIYTHLKSIENLTVKRETLFMLTPTPKPANKNGNNDEIKAFNTTVEENGKTYCGERSKIKSGESKNLIVV